MVHFPTIAHLLEGELYRARVQVLERYSEMLYNDVHNTAIVNVTFGKLQKGTQVNVVGVFYEEEEEQVWFDCLADGVPHRLHPDWLEGVP